METEKTESDALSPEDGPSEERKPTSLLVAQFFLFPLIIIGICVGIFLLFGYMTYEQRTPREYLNEIRSGSENRRWQASYELSNVLHGKIEEFRKPEFVQEVLTIYKDSPDADIKSRRHLALILGELGDRSAVPALLDGLQKDEGLKKADWPQGMFKPNLSQIRDELAQNQIYGLWALGKIGDNAAVPGIVEQLDNEDPSVRKTAAYVLGALGDSRGSHRLQVALNDVKDDVRWTAAMALARMGDATGAEVLTMLIDRAYLETLPEMTPDQKTELMVNAVKCLGLLKHEPTRERIEALSRDDDNLAVRDAALEALKKF